MPSTKAAGGKIYSGVLLKDVKVPVKVRRTLSSVGTSSSNSFCISNLLATLSVDPKLLDCNGMQHPSLKKQRFHQHRSSVHFCSILGIFKYSQDPQAKKAAPIVICGLVLLVYVT
jgi:hypothetical protein